MYRIELISQRELTDLLRRGIRTRTSSITTSDGSNIKLLPNRPVIVSDEAIKLNPAILTDPTIKSRYIPDKKLVQTLSEETFAVVELPTEIEVKKLDVSDLDQNQHVDVAPTEIELSDEDIHRLLVDKPIDTSTVDESVSDVKPTAKRRRK